ncbi:MAG: hypothetical protein CK424_06010 [Legionella sp.]|nr:MAG: hypothetical protein CK424_06010 [Legionella sp.]
MECMTQPILCVDLDGTLILTDTTQEAIRHFGQAHPWQLWKLLPWLCRGRAYLKQQLGQRVHLDPKLLPYHEPFLQWLKEQKAAGCMLVLVTASDQTFATTIADYIGIFSEVMASDGKVNLRAKQKAAALTRRYGLKGYDYAGNSRDDLHVWKEAQHAIVVNASPKVELQAKKTSVVTKVFA